MPDIEMIVAFTLAAFIMNLSPGPSNLYVMARTLEQGVPGGLAAVAGLASGSLLHVVATVLGLSAIIAYSPIAYAVLKTAGAFYLIYLGLHALAHKPEVTGSKLVTENSGRKSYSSIFYESVLVEATNPKTALFFIALLPQFINPAAGPAGPQLLLLGLIVTMSAIPCDLFVTLFTNKAASLLKDNTILQRWQDRLSGTILVALGTYVLLSDSFSPEAATTVPESR